MTVDGVRLATVERGFLNITLDKSNGDGNVVDILVENQGRLCYGSHGIEYLPDPKGIIGEMRIDSHVLQKWKMFPLDDKVTYSIGQNFRWTTFFDGQNFSLDKIFRWRKFSSFFEISCTFVHRNFFR